MFRSKTAFRAVALAVVLGLALVFSALDRAIAQDTGAAGDEAQAAVQAWLAAVASGEASRVEAVLAPEFQLQRADGSGYTRAEYLATGLPQFPSVPVASDLVATVHGDLMVVRYTLNVPPDSVIGGSEVSPVAPRLSVFRRDGDTWMVSAHANFAEPRR